MDRTIVYPGALPRSADILQMEVNMMQALGVLASAAIGQANFVDGLACTPGAGLSVNIGVGSIGQMQQADPLGLAFGGLPVDSLPLLKMGINRAVTNIVVAAPGSAGTSINYLIEVQMQESDDLPVQLPYYNASNPAAPYAGPGNAGTSQNTRRKQTVAIQTGAGVAAPVGTQLTPGADPGWVPLWIVTVAFGAAIIQTTNIYMAPSAPFLLSKVQQQRQKLFAPTTLYVSPTGSDANNGTSTNTAFLTIQAAANSIANNYDLNSFGVGIILSPGTYASAVFTGLPIGYGNGSYVSIGGSGTATIVGTGTIAAITASAGAAVSVGVGVVLQGTIGAQAFGASQVGLNGVGFGACSNSHIIANGGAINITAGYTISGSAPVHYRAVSQGFIACTTPSTIVTLTGSPSFGVAFVQASNARVAMNSTALTFSGAAAAGSSAYLVQLNGVIDTNGSGATYFPGNVAGSAITGGQYA